jgi:GT2 family glycosyltransferase
MGDGSVRRRLRRLSLRLWGRASSLLGRAPLPPRVRQWLSYVARALLGIGTDPRGSHGVSREEAAYAVWRARNALDEGAAREAAVRLGTLRRRPLISILVPVRDPELEHLRLALRSVEAQIYPDWELCIADDASTNPAIPTFLNDYTARQPRARWMRLPAQRHIAGATNAALELARGEFVAFLDHDVLYSDHDILTTSGPASPRFKPDWAPELLLSYMYFGHLKVYRTALVRAVGGLRDGFEGAADYDLALRLVERTQDIHHIPKMLYHWRAAPASMALTSQIKPYSFDSGRRAVEDALRRRHIRGSAVHPEFAERAGLGVYKIQFAATRDLPVTIVIPTRDRLPLLRACIESIQAKTTQRAYRILIIDNESREADTLDYLARSPHRVVRYENGGLFNFAAMMNLGAEQSETEYVVLLNNDTLVINPDWLDELLGYGQLPGVGAVGGKLLYPDGRIQHAGVILGTHGLTGHAFQPRLDTDVLEYGLFAHVARNYLAVTAACMLTRRSVFQEVGGFNDRDLPVAWNDVDYCLRLREKGYRVVFNPYALLYHLESQSRGDDKNPAEIRYMMAHWRHEIDHDPFYSPHLSRRDSEFRIKTDPDEEPFFYYRDYR